MAGLLGRSRWTWHHHPRLPQWNPDIDSSILRGPTPLPPESEAREHKAMGSGCFQGAAPGRCQNEEKGQHPLRPAPTPSLCTDGTVGVQRQPPLHLCGQPAFWARRTTTVWGTAQPSSDSTLVAPGTWPGLC